MVSLKKLKMDFLKNQFLLVIGILFIIIIILIIYNYFTKKSKNIERFYFDNNFTANPENCARINHDSTDDEKTKCCDNNFANIHDSFKSLCPMMDSKKYCTKYLKDYPIIADDC